MFEQAENQSRVSLFVNYVGGGGVERVMFNLASGLVERGQNVDFVVGRAWGPHVKKVPSTVRVVDLNASGVLATTLALKKYLHKNKPAALLSAQHYANEIAIWAKHLSGESTRLVVSEHNTNSQAIRHISSNTRKFLIPIFLKFFYPWADGVVAVSQGVSQDLTDNIGLSPDKVHTIYNPVITPELFEKAKISLDHPWFLPGEPPVILGVGKLEIQKDFPTLIRAFAQVRQVQPARLMILGWGEDQSKLESLVKELGLEEDVSIPGYIDNPYPYIAHAKVFALSSAWEGLPTVLIEAMALGTPVVSTDCPSGPREILEQGKYGYLSPVGDPNALAQSILTVLSGHSKPVNQDWLAQFTSNIATQRYLEVLGLE